MSRLPAVVIGAALSWPAAAFAQNAASTLDRHVQDLITAQAQTTDLRDMRCALGAASADEIVVCAPEDPDKYRYPDRESLPSAQSTRTGIPRAPDFAKPSCKGQVGCISFGKVPPIMPDIDIRALPQAPPGSDADKIAKGEMKDR